MSSGLLFALSGIALIAGGLLATGGWVLFAWRDPDHAATDGVQWLALNGLIIAGGVLMAAGLPGLYAYQAEAMGILGLIGFALLFVGIVIPYVAVQSIETASAPRIPERMRHWVRIGAPALWLGTLVTGVETWQAGVYPAQAGILLIACAVFSPLLARERVPFVVRRNLGATFFTLVVAWLGVLLIRLSG